MQTNSPNNQRKNFSKAKITKVAMPSTTYWIVFFTTIVLLIAATVMLVVALCIEDDNPSGPMDGSYGGGKAPSSSGSGSIANNNTNVKTKTGIKLPCATVSGTYLSSSASGVVEIDGIKSDCAVLVDAGKKTTVAAKNADTLIYPASMTKVMTLLVACEKVKNPNAKLTVTQEMVDYQQSTGGSGNLAFVAGEQITVEDALYLINYRSDTIACLLIAEHVAGGEQSFVALMNEKAREIGLTKTNFTNCTGLHSGNHYTTCREMAAIMNCAINNEAAKKILTSYNGYSVDIYLDGKIERQPTVYSEWYSGPNRMNNNAWVGGGSDVKVLGGKTGYEDIPKACFVTYAQNTESNNYYICVTVGRQAEGGASLNAGDSTADTKTIYKTYAK